MKLIDKWGSLQPSTQVKILQWVGYPLFFTYIFVKSK